MRVSFKGAPVAKDLIRTGVRWDVAYPLSSRPVEERLQERGGAVDHTTINRGVLPYSPPLEAAFHRRKGPVWLSWRMDETYIAVKGPGGDLARAVDKTGQAIACLLTGERDERAARRCLTKAIRRHGAPETSTIEGSGANAAAIRGSNKAHGTASSIRQVTSVHNVVEQGHRAVTRVTRPTLGLTSFDAAPCPSTGIALMQMSRAGQLERAERSRTPAAQCSALAA